MAHPVYINQATADRIREMVGSGVQRQKIAEEIGCSYRTVHKVCDLFDIPKAENFSRFKGRKEALRADVLRLTKVQTQNETARQLRCSKKTVTAILREDNPFHYGGRGAKPKPIQTPAWIPKGWEDEYVQIARARGETEAARWARQAKREMICD